MFYRYVQVRESSPFVPEESLRWWWTKGEIKKWMKGSGREWFEMFSPEIASFVSLIMWGPLFVALTSALRRIKNGGYFKDNHEPFPVDYSFKNAGAIRGHKKAKRTEVGIIKTLLDIARRYILHCLIPFWFLTPSKCQFFFIFNLVKLIFYIAFPNIRIKCNIRENLFFFEKAIFILQGFFF